MITKVVSRADPDRLKLLNELDKLEADLKSVAQQLKGKPGWVELNACVTRLRSMRTLVESELGDNFDWIQATELVVCLIEFIVRLWQ